ncbi:MAG: cupin domain-containing protein [Halioglobus sp.]
MFAGALQDLDKADFLAEIWQQRPLFLPAALSPFQQPLTADELAGLALEEEVESRLVECRRGDWQVHHGPFSEAQLQRAGAWSLLVQAVDHYVEDVAALRDLVDFIPQWRVDDIMLSYGTDGSSVGPHYDNYDVFLLQGEGEKLWRIGQACDEHSELLPHPQLRILADFDCSAEYLLRTGDLLYIPPGIAHWGIAQGQSITYSIGFRAPRTNDMLSRWVDECLASFPQERFFSDIGREPARADGEITGRDRQRALEHLSDALASQPGAGRWFGELVTEPRYTPAPTELNESVTTGQDASGATLHLDAASKLAWQEDADGYTVFANGQSMPLGSAELPCVKELCKMRSLDATAYAALCNSAQGPALLHFLLETGCIYVE